MSACIFRTPQCSSDDLPQLSVFEAFFVSMPCCCRLDLGSVSASRTWTWTEICDEHNLEITRTLFTYCIDNIDYKKYKDCKVQC